MKLKDLARLIANRETDLQPRRTPRSAHTRSTDTPPILEKYKEIIYEYVFESRILCHTISKKYA